MTDSGTSPHAHAGPGALARRLLPLGVKARLREAHRRYRWFRGIRRVRTLPPGAPIADWVLPDLTYGWGNEGWSASTEFLQASLERVRSGQGPILECGSGLSTLLLGMMAAEAGRQVWTLEHNLEWATRMEGMLRKHRVRSVQVCRAPLVDHGSFSWYDVTAAHLPREFSLVVCDGPPSDTPGGRYGLLPVMGERLGKGCTILLDDASRADEQQIARRWADEAGWQLESIIGARRRFAKILVPSGPDRVQDGPRT